MRHHPVLIIFVIDVDPAEIDGFEIGRASVMGFAHRPNQFTEIFGAGSQGQPIKIYATTWEKMIRR